VPVLSRRVLIHWAERGFFDLALAALPLEQHQFKQNAFNRFPVVVALSASHRLCRRKTLELTDLVTENLISMEPFATVQPGVRTRV
jgi:hypothetical protein